MSLKLYDSLSRTQQVFKPITLHKVTLYVCGITPDNATHLGHAFTYVSFDVLVRFLKHKQYDVEYLQNATDINDSDDVISQALKEGKTWEEEAKFWIQHFHMQMDALHVLRPTHYVRATSVIDKIIEVISDLLKKENAYVKDGSIYFDISTFPKYGDLSRYTPEQMLYISKDRGNNPSDPNKKNPLDFVLWSKSTQGPSWNSPWGKGRPGWHIECSTMIDSILGSQIDIHGGGRDLTYPHHESEIAQSESYTGTSPFIKTWMHTAYVLYEGEKMSKSLGNLVLVEDLLKRFSPETIRWVILSHHYKEPWEYDELELVQVEQKVESLKKSLLGVSSNGLESVSQFEELMNDNLNTPKVLELVEGLVYENKKTEAKRILEILGFNL